MRWEYFWHASPSQSTRVFQVANPPNCFWKVRGSEPKGNPYVLREIMQKSAQTLIRAQDQSNWRPGTVKPTYKTL